MILSFFFGCSEQKSLAPESKEELTASAESGERVFITKSKTGNNFSCSSCHNTNEEKVKNKPGHSLFNAVNSCREDWMLTEKFKETDTEWQALQNLSNLIRLLR